MLICVSIAARRGCSSGALEGAASDAARSAAALSSTERVQHHERRTAPDPPRKTPQTTAEALQPASSTSTRPSGKIIHRFPSNTRDNSAEITRGCASIKHKPQALNVIKRDYSPHASSFVLYSVFMCMCNYNT